MKKTLLAIMLSLLSTTSFAKVTDADVDRDSAWFAAQNTTIPQSDIDNQWDQFNRPPHEIDNQPQEEIRMFTSVVRGGPRGVIEQVYIGRFDRQTGKFLGYVNSSRAENQPNGPGWQ